MAKTWNGEGATRRRNRTDGPLIAASPVRKLPDLRWPPDPNDNARNVELPDGNPVVRASGRGQGSGAWR